MFGWERENSKLFNCGTCLNPASTICNDQLMGKAHICFEQISFCASDYEDYEIKNISFNTKIKFY